MPGDNLDSFPSLVAGCAQVSWPFARKVRGPKELLVDPRECGVLMDVFMKRGA